MDFINLRTSIINNTLFYLIIKVMHKLLASRAYTNDVKPKYHSDHTHEGVIKIAETSEAGKMALIRVLFHECNDEK
jgi:hypothetical protein